MTAVRKSPQLPVIVNTLKKRLKLATHARIESEKTLTTCTGPDLLQSIHV